MTGSFKSVDNLTGEQRELIAIRKSNKELEMQVDSLKQAAVMIAHDELEQAITEYIFYYNNKRIKAKLKGFSPVQYRTKSLK